MITVITPTADRLWAFGLCERWMANQSIKPDQWIVADDGIESQPVTMGQEVIRRERVSQGAESLCDNLLAAIDRVRGVHVGIIENDDYYHWSHIQYHVEALADRDIAGSKWMTYYHLKKGWRVMPNKCSTLSNTFFRVELLEDFRQAILEAKRTGVYHVDQLFWKRVNGEMHDYVSVVGMKGLPGRSGLGIGHTMDSYKTDPGYQKLKEWLGDDAQVYIKRAGAV